MADIALPGGLAFYPAVPHNAGIFTNMATPSMLDNAAARRLMVDGQVRTTDVNDPALLDAMLAVPRERFVPPARAQLAYLDNDIPLGKGRALLKPMVLAKLIKTASVGSADHVLLVGCGTGYSAALLARLAGSVVALEEDADLARQAKEALAAVGARKVEIVVGPLAAGWQARAPYDLIFVDGAIEIAPEALARQLKPAGRLACIYGRPPSGQGMVYRLIEGRAVGRPAFDGVAPLLPGFAAPPAFVF